MCGIAGISLKSSSLELDDFIQKAKATISYRGPDHQDHVVVGNKAFIHTRLSIIDPSPAGNQPFQDEEKKYTLVYNGEVFNFFELKNELIQKGYSFRTQTDTEVVFNHLIEYGWEGIKDFNGFFALAFYDHDNDELILARDRSGIKPLYYQIEDDTLYFASDLKALSPAHPEEIDQENVFHYLRYTYSPDTRTVLKGRNKLQPGHYLLWKNNRTVQEDSFGKIPPEKNPTPQLKELIERAVVNRLVADVPLGSFLSGGIDSSIVSLIAQQNTLDLNTYSVGFEKLAIDESKYAEEVAQHIGSAHHKVLITEKEFQRDWEHILDCFDEPFADSSSVAMYFLCKTASKDLRVALSGDGADELMGGYRKHRAFLKAQHQKHYFLMLQPLYNITKNSGESRIGWWGNLSRKINKFMHLHKLSPEERYWELAAFHRKEDVNQLLHFTSKAYPHKISSSDLEKDFNRFLLEDQKNILPNDMLKKVDLMSMHHNMEVRPVFLDDFIVDYCNQLPAHQKINLKEGKLLLRQLYQNDLPQSVFKRKKQGFEIPLEQWLQNLSPTIRKKTYFTDAYLKEQNLFHPEHVQHLLKSFEKGGLKYASLVWTLVVFQHWYSKTFDLEADLQ